MQTIIFITACFVVAHATSRSEPFVWRCEPSVRHKDPLQKWKESTGGDPVCVRHLNEPPTGPSSKVETGNMGHNECRLTCGDYGVLWPKPANATLSHAVAYFRPQFFTFKILPTTTLTSELLGKGIQVFMDNLLKSHPNYSPLDAALRASERHFFGPSEVELYEVHATLNVTNGTAGRLSLSTNEGYELAVHTEPSERRIYVQIVAECYFGVRNALETLSQLIAFDERSNSLMIVHDAAISDAPKFPYRGILLDTSRNFIPVNSIKATLEAMAASKLNTFHWHITDSHSFPMMLRNYPKMTHYGAYDSTKIYTPHDIQDIVEFGRVRGIRVLPEFDAPAHVGNGWQWGHQEGLGDLLACFEKEPWQSFCVEPPCGQLNIANHKIYEVLGNMFAEMVENFGPLDLFHYGGDEVNLDCWNTTEQVKSYMQAKYANLDDNSYYKEWAAFQEKARQLITKANKNEEVPGILWTSHLTEKGRVSQFLDPAKYIIQIWTTGKDPLIKELLDNKFRVIFSNYDALYLDCGFGAWVGEGNNWCSPYIGWQKVYDNRPMEIAANLTNNNFDQNLVLGAEAALWTEQVDSSNMDSKIWPRAAALAERLWSDPTHGWEMAEHRMVYHRQRLLERGVQPERLQPEWCLQNMDLCYI